jgi:hypothetical protein
MLPVGIVRGNPAVFQLNPYPAPEKPLPSPRVRVLEGCMRFMLKFMILIRIIVNLENSRLNKYLLGDFQGSY